MSKEEPLKAYLEEQFSHVNRRLSQIEKATVLETAGFTQLIETMKGHSDGLTRFMEETMKFTKEVAKGFNGVYKFQKQQAIAIGQRIVQLTNVIAEREKTLREAIEKMADEDLKEMILDQISFMGDTNGVELNSLLKVLKSENDVGEDDALRLIEQLKKDNRIYEPKPGYLKRKNTKTEKE